ncbi:MAG: alpha/beta fold hydrolase, partial [Mycobacteriales bacterium]
TAVVCGHGLGGAVAAQMAGISPERVSALVLIDAALHAESWPPTPARQLLSPLRGELLAASLEHSPERARRFLSHCLGTQQLGGALPSPADHCLTALRQRGGATALMRFGRAVDLESSKAAWRAIRASGLPTLVLWGERDSVISPAYGQRLAAESPRGVWVPVPDAGHLLPAQRPERVAEEISAFLVDVAGADASAPTRS